MRNYPIKTAGLGVRPETDWSPMDGNYHPIATQSANQEIITIISNTEECTSALPSPQLKIILNIDDQSWSDQITK